VLLVEDCSGVTIYTHELAQLSKVPRATHGHLLFDPVAMCTWVWYLTPVTPGTPDGNQKLAQALAYQQGQNLVYREAETSFSFPAGIERVHQVAASFKYEGAEVEGTHLVLQSYNKGSYLVTVCQAGYQVSTGTTCFKCDPGQYGLGSQSACQPCTLLSRLQADSYFLATLIKAQCSDTVDDQSLQSLAVDAIQKISEKTGWSPKFVSNVLVGLIVLVTVIGVALSAFFVIIKLKQRCL
jgi:hypothetical protein